MKSGPICGLDLGAKMRRCTDQRIFSRVASGSWSLARDLPGKGPGSNSSGRYSVGARYSREDWEEDRLLRWSCGHIVRQYLPLRDFCPINHEVEFIMSNVLFMQDGIRRRSCQHVPHGLGQCMTSQRGAPREPYCYYAGDMMSWSLDPANLLAAEL